MKVLTGAFLLGAIASSVQAKDLKDISLGFNAGSIMDPLVVIADKAGYFKDEGLNVELINVGMDGPVAVNQGKVWAYPFGVGGLQWVAKKGEVVFFGGTMNEGSAYVTKPENASLFKDLKNFKGKKVATLRLSTADHSVRIELKKIGLNPDTDIQYIEFDTFPSIIEALAKGTVDVGILSLESSQLAIKRGLAISFYAGEVAPNYVCCKQIANKKLLKEDRSAYVSLLKAQIRAYKVYLEDHDRTIKYLIDYSNQTKEFIVNVLYTPDAFAHFIVTPDPYRNKLKEYYKALEDEGVFAKGVNVDDYIDVSIYKDALDQIVKENPKDPVYAKLLADFPKNNL